MNSRNAFRLILSWLLVGLCFPHDGFATDKRAQGKQQKTVHNLPDIDLTPKGKIELDQETNFFSTGGQSNTLLEYGASHGWDIGVGLFNAQFFAVSSNTWNFQPDLLFNLEKHWQALQGELIVGTLSGIGYLPQGKRLVDITYLDYQHTLSKLDIDLDFGAYYANAAIANLDSVGLHINVELPVYGRLRLNGDYLSGHNGIGGSVIKLLYSVGKDWNIGLGVQIPTVYQGDHYVGMLGVYSQ